MTKKWVWPTIRLVPRLQNISKKASYYAQLVKNEGHSLTAKYWDFFIDICSDKYNTALNKDGAKANESIWEVEFAGNRSTDVRAEGRIGNIIGIQGKDLSSKASITGKGDPGYAYAFIWNTPKLLELYEANDDIDRCNWNIAPFTYTQSAGEGTPVDGREFVKGKRDEVEQQYWDKSFSYGKTEPGSTYGDRESKNDANRTATELPPNIVENMKQTRRVKTILPSTSLFSVTLTFC